MNGIFQGETPNRDNCVEGWLPDFEDSVDNENITSSDNTNDLENNLQNTDGPISGQALGSLPDSLQKILEKRESEFNNNITNPDDDEEQMDFYWKFMKNVDFLVSSDETWRSLSADGYNISTAYINRTTSLGELFLKYSPKSCKYNLKFQVALQCRIIQGK